jgi:hypothetical protein
MKLPYITGVMLIASAMIYLSPSVAHADQIAASMCDYVKADDKNRLRKLLSDNRLRLRNIYDGVNCNGNNLVRFAVANNAAGAGEFIIKQLSASQIKADLDWAKANHAGSPLVAVLQERAGAAD